MAFKIPDDQIRIADSPTWPRVSYRITQNLTLLPSTTSGTLDWKFKTVSVEPLRARRDAKRNPLVMDPHDLYVYQRSIVEFDIFLLNRSKAFLRDLPMTLYKSIPASFRALYTDLRYVSPDNIRFIAQYLSNKEMLHHPCQFYTVDANHGPRISSGDVDVIDPDILNPGDHH